MASGFATFLLGALDGSSQMIGGPAPDPHVTFWGMFLQDDWKVKRWLTINMGLRNEYESPWYDPNHNMSQGLDLNQPIPEMQANPPKMPAQALALMGSTFRTSGTACGSGPATAIRGCGMPRSWRSLRASAPPSRSDETTALRVGYARYLSPYEMILSQAPVSGFETVSFLEPPFFGMKSYQNTAGLLQGVPQQTIANPFPSSVNPLIAPNGKAAGTAVGRGGIVAPAVSAEYAEGPQRPLQRQLPAAVAGPGRRRRLPGSTTSETRRYSYALNNRDPRIDVAQQNAINTTVDNPFYNYLTPALFPGPLRNQKTVSLASLLTQYPQYGGLWEVGKLGAAERYHSLEFKAQKAFSKGWNFLGATCTSTRRPRPPA